jgi:UDP-N-acetylmuramoyl-tripeptide--D-alanyl-D-alanine ligase
MEAAGKNIFGWLFILLTAAKLILFKGENYPKILILEMAVDKPGDMDYLTGFIRPKIGVLTRIGPVHLEKFGTQEKILQEKSKLIKSLPPTGAAILNYDCKDVLSLRDETRAKCITYGFDDGADVRAKNILFSRGQSSFTLEIGEKSVPVVLLHGIGKPQIYAILTGIAAGIYKGMEIEEIKEALKNYYPPQGRGNLIRGIKNTFIIDDSYNASPQSVEAALENLKNLADRGRSIAVLGDMLELGIISSDAHLEIGRKVAEGKINYLFTVGMRARGIAKGAQMAGMHKDRIYSFDDNLELGKFLKDKIEEGDTVLIKGSRGMKMEEVVEEIKL